MTANLEFKAYGKPEQYVIQPFVPEWAYMTTEQTPDYYTRDGIQCADAIRPFVDRLSGNQAFYVGSILKYLWRFGEKAGADPIGDLRKVIQYTQMTIKEIEADCIDKK